MSDRMSDVARLVGEKAQLNALVEQLTDTARVALELQMAAEAALSSAERRIEELVRERDNAKYELARFKVAIARQPDYETHWEEATERADAAEALVTTLKAEVEELKRERDEARSAVLDAATGDRRCRGLSPR